jgi:hypothetical protein
MRGLVRHRFIVTMVDGQAFDGLLMEADDHSVVLRDAKALVKEGAEVKSVPADGEIVLPRARVAYLQRPIEAT